MGTKTTSAIGFAIVFGVIGVFSVHNLANWPEPEPLEGAQHRPEKVDLTFENWFSGDYQEYAEPAFRDYLASRPAFVRTYNELHYQLYDESKTYVLLGRNDQLFAYNYFPSFRGFDHKGEEHWERIAGGLAQIRDSLAYHGIPFLVIIAPNKVRYMPENLPENLIGEPGEVSNQATLMQMAGKYNLEILDLNTAFLRMKDTVQYPLFPNTGTHWSAYGALIGSDMILEKMSALLDTAVVDLIRSPGSLKDSLIGGDDELSKGLNKWLLWKTIPLYYPEVSYDTINRVKPNALFISDSFFWTINSVKMNKRALSRNHSFWFYNNTNYDERHGEIPVDSLNRWEEMLSRDIIILMGTESNLTEFPYHLISDLNAEKEGKE